MHGSPRHHALRRLGGLLSGRLAGSHLGAVMRAAGMVMGIRIAGAAIALASQVLLARWMGAFEYGIFSYVWVWVVILGILAPMGFGTSTLRFVPGYRARAKWRRLAGIVDASWRVVLIAALSLMSLALLVLAALRNEIEPHYLAPLAVALLCVPGFALTDSLEGTARAFGWVNLAYFPAYIVRPLGIVLLAGGVYLLTGELNGFIAVSCAFAATLVTLAGQRLLLRHRIRRTVPHARPAYHLRHWVGASMPLLLVEGLYLLLINTDIVLLGYFVDPGQVGIYFAATRIANLVVFIHFAVAALAVPKFAELHAEDSPDALRRFMRAVIQLTFWPTLAAAAVILALGGFLLGLFGEGFAQGYPLLAILMLGFLARASTGPVEHLLNMTGNQNMAAAAYGGAALINLVLNLVLVPRLGLEGAAIATAVSLAFASIWLFFAARRRLGITAFVLAPASV
jgi:O-antigen/teichoic acid export membrane protein